MIFNNFLIRFVTLKDEIIYSNFCLEDDFEELKQLNIHVKDKIVICKYGKIFRGNKVQIVLWL
jgi:hypothetical protein